MVALPWAASSGDWHPFQSLLFPWRVNAVSRTSEEGISVHITPCSVKRLQHWWCPHRCLRCTHRTRDKSGPVSISFRAATYSFKTAGVKIPWKRSSKCYKALYSILSDKLETNNRCEGKGVGGSATGRGEFVDSRDCAACCDRQFVLTTRKASIFSTKPWAS